MSAVVCQNIEKTYHVGDIDVKALQGVDLSLDRGKLLMVVGPSGSGKTTLISIIAGILSTDAGTCQVLGQDITALRNSELTAFRGKEIGFVFQAFNLVPMLSAQENVAVPLLLNDVSFEEAMDRSATFLGKVGLSDKLGISPSNLSGGQMQRVAIARSCIHEPSLIVCDEPTSSLDHETGAHVMDLFRNDVLHQDRAIIIVTHDARIFSYADAIIHLDDGKIVDSS